jgi:hypothetical protein
MATISKLQEWDMAGSVAHSTQDANLQGTQSRAKEHLSSDFNAAAPDEALTGVQKVRRSLEGAKKAVGKANALVSRSQEQDSRQGG